MAEPLDLRAAMGPLRWGAFLVLAGALTAVVVPGLLGGSEVTLLGARAPVPSIAPWSLPAPEAAFSLPPQDPGASVADWAAAQLAMAVYGVAVLVYYAGLAALAVGAGLLAVALRRLARQADGLGR